MAGIKISELINAPILDGTEIIPIAKDGANTSITLSQTNALFNVRAFGATGDGITDDTAAIKRAIAHFGPYKGAYLGGGIGLYFPAGRYNISETIEIANSCFLLGDGSDQGTIIRLLSGSNCDMFKFGISDSSDPVSIHMKGFRLEMTHAEQSGTICNIRMINRCRHSLFEDIFCYGSPSTNVTIEVVGGYDSAMNTYFSRCFFETAKYYGVYVTNHSYNLNFDQCYFGFGNSDVFNYKGIYITGFSHALKITNCWFLPDCYYNNIDINTACRHIIISDNIFTTDDINSGGSSCVALTHTSISHVLITNNIVYKNGNNYDYCFRINAATDVVICNNIFDGYDSRPVYSSSSYVKQHVYNNYDKITGKKNESKGSATITDGNSTLVVTHGCYKAPQSVIVTSNKNEYVWVTDITDTQFTLNRSGSTADLVCYYNAYTYGS